MTRVMEVVVRARCGLCGKVFTATEKQKKEGDVSGRVFSRCCKSESEVVGGYVIFGNGKKAYLKKSSNHKSNQNKKAK